MPKCLPVVDLVRPVLDTLPSWRSSRFLFTAWVLLIVALSLFPQVFRGQNAFDFLVWRIGEANAYYRKHKTLDGCPGITEKDREWLTRPGVFAKGDGSPLALYGVPFPSYDLQRDTADIRSYAARLEEYDRLQAQRDADTDTEFDGGRIVRNVEQNRLQIIFDGKPDEETRAALKSNGFRWSPRNQAWQRQLTRNAEDAARRALNLSDTAPAPAPEEQAAPAVPEEITPEAAEADDFPQYSIPGA